MTEFGARRQRDEQRKRDKYYLHGVVPGPHGTELRMRTGGA